MQRLLIQAQSNNFQTAGISMSQSNRFITPPNFRFNFSPMSIVRPPPPPSANSQLVPPIYRNATFTPDNPFFQVQRSQNPNLQGPYYHSAPLMFIPAPPPPNAASFGPSSTITTTPESHQQGPRTIVHLPPRTGSVQTFGSNLSNPQSHARFVPRKLFGSDLETNTFPDIVLPCEETEVYLVLNFIDI